MAANQNHLTSKATTQDVITAENVKTMAERIAIKALKTCFQSGKGYTPEQAEHAKASGKDPNKNGNFSYVYSLYCGLIADITDNLPNNKPLSDGYDVAQQAALYLCGHYGENLQAIDNNEKLCRSGEPATILRGCFRAVNRYINNQKTYVYKHQYLDDVDENGLELYYELPLEWDVATADDFERLNELIKGLDLDKAPKQAQVLRYRLRGIAVDGDCGREHEYSNRDLDSVHTIARKMGITRAAVYDLLDKLKARAIKLAETDVALRITMLVLRYL